MAIMPIEDQVLKHLTDEQKAKLTKKYLKMKKKLEKQQAELDRRIKILLRKTKKTTHAQGEERKVLEWPKKIG